MPFTVFTIHSLIFKGYPVNQRTGLMWTLFSRYFNYCSGEVEMVEYIFKSLRVPVYIIIYMCTQRVYNYYPTISTISTHMRHKWQAVSFTNFWLGYGLLSNRKIAKSINLLSFIYQTCSNKSLDIYAVSVSKTRKFCDRDWQTDKTPTHRAFAVFLETVKTDRRLTAHRL